MFKQSIATTLLTSDTANSFFTNITGEAYGSDTTFLATLRALVAPRLPEGESVHLSFGRSSYSDTQIAESHHKTMVTSICNAMPQGNGQIYIHNLASRDDASSAANISLLKNKFTSAYPGWQILDKVSEFYQKSFKVLCFVNPDKKSVAIFVEQLNLQKLHYLQMSTLAILPWYFDAQKGIDEVELELLKSLRERSSSNYESCISKISGRYDFESARIKRLLQGFETKLEQAECERVKREITSVDRRIKDLDRQFAEYLQNRDNLCVRLMGLEKRIEDGGDQSEIMDYFLCNRRLVLEEVSSTAFYFGVRDYLTYFDEDAARSYIDNDRSYFYRNCDNSSGTMNKEGLKKLLTAIFIDQTIRIRFCAAYYFDLNGSVSAQAGHHFGVEFDGYKPNPHIDEYSCIGNYKRTINDALMRRDYITALEQSIASAKSLNLHDSPVMSNFVNQFTRNGGAAYKAIELPDGRVVSPKDAVKWIEDQEATAKTAAEPIVADTVSESATRTHEVPEDVTERIHTELPF